MTPHDNDDACWAAVTRRDASADGQFYYAVRSTGVYCRPSCPARLARRENVSFHRTCEDAEHAGYRPCRRCRPHEAGPAAERRTLVVEACRRIETADQPPSLDALAQAAGLSRFHFHRLFKAVTGLTPRSYAAACRGGRLRQALHGSRTVTEAIYDAGFNSSGRCYAATDTLLGMTPSRFRAGGRGLELRYAASPCSLGAVLVAATTKGIAAILLGDAAEPLVEELAKRFPQARLIPADADFAATVGRVVALVEIPGRGLELPLDLQGTLFQQRVWQALRDIPPGTTATYAEIADRIGRPTAVRAVASAIAANPAAVAVPCHRVVRSDGKMGGYHWGTARKRALLDREQG